jgi:hypothetical protein
MCRVRVSQILLSMCDYLQVRVGLSFIKTVYSDWEKSIIDSLYDSEEGECAKKS